MALTILEASANVRQAKRELDETLAELRRAGHESTDLSMAADYAMKIADDGLRNCWEMLNSLLSIAATRCGR